MYVYELDTKVKYNLSNCEIIGIQYGYIPM